MLKLTKNQTRAILQSINAKFVSDVEMACELRAIVLGPGHILPGHSDEGKYIRVKGYGFDELGNVIALCEDGYTRLYYGNKFSDQSLDSTTA